ncbi:SAC3 family protein C isoform X2 [Macadamia integrifolia]|uniref:SAC3 family protein C isoform X2 n=1 Tax=Macadamia integrifolia TaxID=60698 RepID=UPI001C52ABFB|nr:SAC3 family protein C isoform X2 [Macadamia integrifolia]
MNTSRRKSRKSFSSSMGGRGHQSNASEEAESSKGVSIRGRILEDEDRHQSIESIHVSSTFPSIVGTCTLMCPARERVQRERLRDLSVFERLNGHLGKTSPSLAVKKFCRTISTMRVQESDVRTLPVLKETLHYLLNLLDSSEQPFEVVHDFVFDRTRSIRQDLSMQNIVNDEAIHMYEEMVKFYIVSHHKLLWSNCNPNISSMHYLNLEQLRKSLSSLYDMYDANRKSSSISKNEAEFRSFYVLLHLSSNSQSVRLASPILKSKEMCFTRKVLRFFRLGNYKCFFATIATESSYLQYCLMEPYINELRILVVSYINYGGYAHSPYPLAQLSKLLRMKESDMESLCNACGLETSIDKVGNKFLPTKQATFHPPKGGFQNYSFLGLEKLQRHTRDEDCITTNQAS